MPMSFMELGSAMEGVEEEEEELDLQGAQNVVS